MAKSVETKQYGEIVGIVWSCIWGFVFCFGILDVFLHRSGRILFICCIWMAFDSDTISTGGIPERMLVTDFAWHCSLFTSLIF